MVVISYVVIGVLPRTLGRQHPYRVGLLAAGTTRAVAAVLSPVANLLILHRQRDHPRSRLPGGSVLLRDRAA